MSTLKTPPYSSIGMTHLFDLSIKKTKLYCYVFKIVPFVLMISCINLLITAAHNQGKVNPTFLGVFLKRRICLYFGYIVDTLLIELL